MADFITSMTQRTLGLLPVVQPIIASKYVSEAMGAAAPGALTLLDPFPGQMTEEPFEHWEEPTEQLPPVALPQTLLPRAVHAPTSAIPGVSPSVASPQKQPSTAPAQQATPAPVRTQAAPPSKETTGGNPPPSLVPQSQTSSTRNEVLPSASRPPAENRSPVRKNMSPVANESVEIVSSQPQSDASPENPSDSASPPVSTTKPRRGQGKSSARTHQPMDSTTLVPAQSGAIPPIPQLPQAGSPVVLSKGNREQQHISSSLTSDGSSFESASPMPVPESTSGNPSTSRRNIVRARPKGAETALVPEQEQSEPEPGRGQAAPLPYMKSNTSNPYRVGARLVPALVPALPSNVSIAESDLIEPLLPPAYTPLQNRRVETPATGKRVEAHLSETPTAPTIHVTIGRIEVRAVTPAPPAAPAPVRTQRAQPALSLEDYLKQRNGGQP